MPGKWAPTTGVVVPSSSCASATLVRRARAGSTSPSEAQSSSTSSTGQCTTSPSNTPRAVPDESTRITLPGVCPGARRVSMPGSRGPSWSKVASRSSSAPSAAKNALAPAPGRTTKWSQSRAWQRKVALANSDAPSAVAQPEWSGWRWVSTTSVTSAGSTPTSRNRPGSSPPAITRP